MPGRTRSCHGVCDTTMSWGLLPGSVRRRAAERHRAVLWLAVSSGIAGQFETLVYNTQVFFWDSDTADAAAR